MKRRLLLGFLFAATWLIGAALSQVVTQAPFPQGAQPNNLVASNTWTTSAQSTTLTGVSGKFTYLCGFVVTSTGTTPVTLGDITITGTVTTSMNYEYLYPNATQGILGIAFPGCITSSNKGTSIVINVPASGGSGTVGATTMWGYTN